MTEQDLQDLKELLTSMVEVLDKRFSAIEEQLQDLHNRVLGLETQMTPYTQPQSPYQPYPPTYPGVPWTTTDVRGSWVEETVTDIFGNVP